MLRNIVNAFEMKYKYMSLTYLYVKQGLKGLLFLLEYPRINPSKTVTRATPEP